MSVVKLVNTFTKAGIKLAVTDDLQLKIFAPNGAMTDGLKQLLVENKAKLIDHLQRYSFSDRLDLPEVLVTKRDKKIPLSFSQRRLWFVDQLNQGSAEYNSLNYLAIDGEFSEPCLRQALEQLLRRHEVLRTCFATVDGETVQVIKNEYSLPIQTVDISSIEEVRRDAEIRRLAMEEVAQAFDLSSDLMLRVKLVKCSAKQHIIFYVTHHIASDGWSAGILRRELIALYQAACNNSPAALPDLTVQYADYAVWQRSLLACEPFKKQLSYWLGQLDGMPQLHSLPLDRSRLNEQLFVGRTVRQTLTESTVLKARALCRERDLTLFMLLHGTLSVLISRFTNERDIVIGTAIAGRTQQAFEPLIGFFVNDLVLRARFHEDQTALQFLEEHKRTILSAYQNQAVPFDMLVEKLNPPRSATHSPLFQIKMDLQNHRGSDHSPHDHDANDGQDDLTHRSREDLYLSVIEQASEIRLEWRYNTDLFDLPMVESLMECFQVLLESICDDVNQKISRLELLTQRRRADLIELGRCHVLPPVTHQCIHHWIEYQVSQTPDRLAVVCGEESLTYRELNDRANRVAHFLISQGTRADTLVGICTERSVEMIVGVFAILKSGGAYVPLDPSYPRARLQFMLDDCGFDIVLTQQHLMSEINFGCCNVFPIDGDMSTMLALQFSADNPIATQVKCRAHDLAYAIYTSGSTGTPRAVLVSHGNLVSSTAARLVAYSQQPSSYILLSSFAFDSSVAGIFWTLVTGGKLVIADPTDGLDAEKFERLMVANDASHFLTLPSVYHRILNHGISVPESVKQVIVAGEPCTRQVLSAHYEHPKWKSVALTNEYGPTEASVWSSYFHCKDGGHGVVPIGVNAPHVNLYVLDDKMQLAPRGVIGELAVAGMGVSRGYLNQPEVTSQKYLPDNFLSDGVGMLYRTGDLVRWSSSGELEYTGRIDSQVKMRGFRVELLEVETKLMQLGEVEACTVVVQQTDSSDQRLVAYVVLKQSLSEHEHMEDSYLQGVELTVDQVRNALVSSFRKRLQAELPDYMVPSVIVVLEKLPLSPNGKVDKQALPKPNEADTHSELYVAPSTKTEENLCTMWAQVLSLELVGVRDNFFLLGGHSLLATRLVSSIRDQFRIELPLRAIFDCPTIIELAVEIDSRVSTMLEPSIVNVFSDNESALSESDGEIEEGVL